MITYINGLEEPSNIITFTNVPTILSVVFDNVTENPSQLSLKVSSLNNLSATDEYTITVNNHKIVGTFDRSRLSGGKFYLTTTNTIQQQKYVAYTIANALKNIPELNTNYDIYVVSDEDGTTNEVLVKSRKNVYQSITFETNIPTATLSPTITNGNEQAYHKKVVCDIYKFNGTPKLKGSDNLSNSDFITSLEKTVASDRVMFDLSPLFKSFTENGYLSEFMVSVYVISDGGIIEQKTIKYIFSTNGYLVNQGSNYLPSFDGVFLAQNVSRGDTKPSYNQSLIYVYDRSLDISFYSTSDIKTLPITVNYLDGAYNTVLSEEKTISLSSSLTDLNIVLNNIYSKCQYIDIVFEGKTLRYNVIKPIRGTGEFQRVYWRNSYGGVSFFDFTGERSERRKTTVDTYNSNLFDYYQRSEMERKKVYNKDVEVSVSLSTHNMEKDGQWQLFDLQNSTEAWTVVNGKVYKIIITDIEISEQSTSGIYVGRITYDYSLGDSF